jgi:DNA-binding CsgD family transcriptional regulator
MGLRAAAATKRRAIPQHSCESHQQEQERLREEARRIICRLHERELEALQFIAMGVYDKKAATLMRIGISTFKSYRYTITKKTGLSGRVNLARLAFRSGVASIWSSEHEPPPAS